MGDPISRVQLSPNRHSGGRHVLWLAFHTQQARSSAAGLANYCGNPNSQVSYNAVADELETVLLVPYDQNPWAAANANSYADHFCFAGSFAEWSREQWLDPDQDADGVNQDLMMWRGAAWLAERATVRGIPLVYVGADGVREDRPGIVGHMDFGSWGGGHTDPGPSFPWDELIRRAKVLQGGDELSAAEVKQIQDFVAGFCGPIGSDVKDIREQLTGGRDGGEYPGWGQLDNKTVVDALADMSKRLKALEGK